VDDLFLIAEVKAIRGSNGYVLIKSLTDFRERFSQLREVVVEFFGTKKEFQVEDVEFLEGKIALKLNGFNSADDAAVLLNKKIFIQKKHAVKLDKDTFFIHDVIGSAVYKDIVLIGNVEDVLVLPANDVYVVKDKNNK